MVPHKRIFVLHVNTSNVACRRDWRCMCTTKFRAARKAAQIMNGDEETDEKKLFYTVAEMLTMTLRFF